MEKLCIAAENITHMFLSIPFLAFRLDVRIKRNKKLFKSLLNYVLFMLLTIFYAVFFQNFDLCPIPLKSNSNSLKQELVATPGFPKWLL